MSRRSAVSGRVLHVSTAHPWTDNRVHVREADSLARAGFDVGLYAVANDLDVESGVKVTTIPALSRGRRMTLGTLRALRFALNSQAEVIHLHDPELLWTIPVLRAAGRRVIYDAHEELATQVLHKPYLPMAARKPLANATRQLVKIANQADHIIAATETVAASFDSSRTTVVKNYPPAPSADRTAPISERPLDAVYVGGITEARGVRDLVDAFSEGLAPQGWGLQLAGWATPDFLEELRSSPGWERTTFHGTVAPGNARELVERSRVGLVILRDTPAHREALPTKMFEYMAAGVPVIASDFPLWRRIVEEHDCGVVVPAGDPAAIAEAISSYDQDRDLLERHSRNGEEAVLGELCWEVEARKLIRAYEAVVGHRPCSSGA